MSKRNIDNDSIPPIAETKKPKNKHIDNQALSDAIASTGASSDVASIMQSLPTMTVYKNNTPLHLPLIPPQPTLFSRKITGFNHIADTKVASHNFPRNQMPMEKILYNYDPIVQSRSKELVHHVPMNLKPFYKEKEPNEHDGNEPLNEYNSNVNDPFQQETNHMFRMMTKIMKKEDIKPHIPNREYQLGPSCVANAEAYIHNADPRVFTPELIEKYRQEAMPNIETTSLKERPLTLETHNYITGTSADEFFGEDRPFRTIELNFPLNGDNKEDSMESARDFQDKIAEWTATAKTNDLIIDLKFDNQSGHAVAIIKNEIRDSNFPDPIQLGDTEMVSKWIERYYNNNNNGVGMRIATMRLYDPLTISQLASRASKKIANLRNLYKTHPILNQPETSDKILKSSKWVRESKEFPVQRGFGLYSRMFHKHPTPSHHYCHAHKRKKCRTTSSG